MGKYDFIKIKKKLSKYLDEARFEHTMGVMYTCAALVMVYGYPFLLHAKLGAYVASSKYDIKDEEILTAITYHTTGRPGMSLLEKIVYISDYIEPMRDKAPNLPKVRKIAFEDLDECMYEILKDTLEYLEENPKEIDSTTRDAYVYYKDLHDRKMQDAANRQED